MSIRRAVVFTLVLSACTDSSENLRVVTRVSDPSAKVDALLVVEDRGGATVPEVHAVYVVPKGALPKPQDLVMRGDKLRGLTLRWREPQMLELNYEVGRIFSFTNFWQHANVDNYKYVAEIRLSPPPTGNALPP